MPIALLVSLHITGEQRENKNGVKQWNQGKSQKKREVVRQSERAVVAEGDNPQKSWC